MTRIFTDGAEMGDNLFWDYVPTPIGLPTVTAETTPTPISGEWCYAGAYLGAFKLIGSNLGEFYLRYRLRTNNATAAQGAQMLGWRNSTYDYGYLSVDPLNRFCVYVGNTIVDTSDYSMQEDTWYLIEIHAVVDDVGGLIEVFVDGTQLINYSGPTNPSAPPTHPNIVDNIYFDTTAYTAVYIDDLALNDTNGLSDNSWCGDGMIVKMVPNGDGAHNNWTNSDGDSINNYTYVNEYPNDGDLTYVYADGSDSGLQDQYTLSDLDYTNKTVLRIYPEARARKSAASAYTLKLGILPSGGVDEMSAGRTLFSDYYSRIVGNEYTVNPVDSNPWEEADLDSLQFIAEVG